MKSIFSSKFLILLSSVMSSVALAYADRSNDNSYRVSIEIRESGELQNCPNFVGWMREKNECVFRFDQVVSVADARLDYTGMVGWAKSSGEIDFQYYVGDIDSGLSFNFRIPSINGRFVFGDEPYTFEIGAGDYATNAWAAKGLVTISEIQ